MLGANYGGLKIRVFQPVGRHLPTNAVKDLRSEPTVNCREMLPLRFPFGPVETAGELISTLIAPGVQQCLSQGIAGWHSYVRLDPGSLPISLRDRAD